MFKSIHLGDDQYSKVLQEQKKLNDEKKMETMDRLIRIESACDQIIKKLNRLQEDLDSVDQKIANHDTMTHDKLIEICNIVEDINECISNRE